MSDGRRIEIKHEGSSGAEENDTERTDRLFLWSLNVKGESRPADVVTVLERRNGVESRVMSSQSMATTMKNRG